MALLLISTMPIISIATKLIENILRPSGQNSNIKIAHIQMLVNFLIKMNNEVVAIADGVYYHSEYDYISAVSVFIITLPG